MPERETFFDLSDVREKLECWRLDYNQARPHSALGDRSPEEFVREWKESSAASSRTAGPANQTPAGAVHCSDTADPKLTPLFVPPSERPNVFLPLTGNSRVKRAGTRCF